MGWCILILVLFGLFVLGKIAEQKEKDEEILNIGYDIFSDESLKNLSVKEQIEFLNKGWGIFCSSNNIESATEYAYNKLKEYIRMGYFSNKKDKVAQNNTIEVAQTSTLNNKPDNNYDDYYSDEDIDIETGEILEAYRDSADDLDYEAFEEKIEIWEKYIEIAKKKGYISPQADGYSQLAQVYVDMNNYEKAIENYTIAIELQPDSDSVVYYYSSRARVYDALCEYDKEIEDHTTLIERGCTSYYKDRAEIYCKLKKYENAISDYTSAINATEGYIKNPNPDSLAVIGCGGIEGYTIYENGNIRKYKFKRGIAYLELKMYDEAIRDFKVLTEKDKEYKEAKEYLRKALVEKGSRYIDK